MTARVPGTTEVVGGVKLASHQVRAVIRDGFARTEIEEVFENETDRVLEGRYVFPLPPDASISRLALWVGDKLMEGEVVEKKRAAEIFKSIVEDTVRPRDPALLEWVSGSEFSLKVFPLPAKGTRKVLLAYDQALVTEAGRVRYTYPLFLGKDRTSRIGRLSMQVDVSDTRSELRDLRVPGYAARTSLEPKRCTVAFDAASFSPPQDFVVTYERAQASGADVSAFVPRWGDAAGDGLAQASKVAASASGESAFFAARVLVDLPPNAPAPVFQRRDRAIVVDTSHSQSRETLDAAARVVSGILNQMDPDERFVLLACNAACTSWPKNGLSPATGSEVRDSLKWLGMQSPSGSSDLAGSISEAAARLQSDGSGQVIYLGDGSATSGELNSEAIRARVWQALSLRQLDLRLLGVGHSLDEVLLADLASRVGATYERVGTGEALASRIAGIADGLRRPVVTSVSLELPIEFMDIYPRVLPNLRLGQEFVVVGKLSKPVEGALKLKGKLGGQPYELTRDLVWAEGAPSQNPLVPRLWAMWRVLGLQGGVDAAGQKEVIDLSHRFRVMSRPTSWLVLENEAMYAEFGIRRTEPGGVERPKAQPAGGMGLSELASLSNALQMLDVASLGLGSPATAGILRGEPGGSGLDSMAASNSGVGVSGRTGLSVLAAPPGGTTTSLSAANAPKGNASLGSTTVAGGTLPNAARTVARMRGAFRACYNQGLAVNPDMAGTVTVTARIGPNGEVVMATASAGGTMSRAVADCIAARVRGAQFDPPEGGSGATIVIPVRFELRPR